MADASHETSFVTSSSFVTKDNSRLDRSVSMMKRSFQNEKASDGISEVVAGQIKKHSDLLDGKWIDTLKETHL